MSSECLARSNVSSAEVLIFPIKNLPGPKTREFCQWRRGELNPRPEITRMAASTCLVGVLISNPGAIADNLPRVQAVCFSPADQRPNPPASPHFAAVASRATRRAEVACYQAAIRTGAAKPTRPATSLLAVNVLLGDLRGQRASSACHHHRRHPVETDRPRQ